jgi:hypothetical protein
MEEKGWDWNVLLEEGDEIGLVYWKGIEIGLVYWMRGRNPIGLLEEKWGWGRFTGEHVKTVLVEVEEGQRLGCLLEGE